MKRHPHAQSGKILEWMMLKEYFDCSNDKKVTFAIRDDFERDFRINFKTGVVTRVTDQFTNDYFFHFMQTSLMK